jgi:hypothetical protein
MPEMLLYETRVSDSRQGEEARRKAEGQAAGEAPRLAESSRAANSAKERVTGKIEVAEWKVICLNRCPRFHFCRLGARI